MQTLVRALAVVVLVGTMGCVFASGQRGAVGSSAAAVGWAAQFVGTRPHALTVFRTYPGVDANEVESGWFRSGSSSDQIVVMAMTSCRQDDGYGDPEVLAVLHSVAPLLDAGRVLVSRSGDREAGFTLVGQAASGVRSYRPRETTEDAATLYVLPSGTWVLARGPAAQRVGWALASHAQEPPYLDALPGAWMETTRDADSERVRHVLGQVRGGDRVTAVGEVVYTPAPNTPRGTPPIVGVKLVFSDEDTARIAADDEQRLFAATPPNPLNYGTVRRFGATIVLTGSGQ